MSTPPSPATTAVYVLWILTLIIALFVFWPLVPVVFGLGALALYPSRAGQPLHLLVSEVQELVGLNRRAAQGVALGAGLAITVLLGSVIGLMQQEIRDQQVRERQQQDAQRQQELVALQRREAVAKAELAAEQARAKAAAAEADRLRAATEAAAERRRQADAATALKRQQEREAAQKKAATERAARAAEAARQAALREQQRQQEAAARQKRARVQAQQQAQAEAQEAAQPTSDEGPYTQEQVVDLCKDEYAAQIGANAATVIQAGKYFEIMNNQPQNMRFGSGHVWFWRPPLRLAGQENWEARTVLCRVYDDGRVEVVDP